ncbi:MAG TPA: efflux RND transporter periplasmic adaptor subunit [Planctomycetota bacterium]|nr:efflux RND transporter periplasmic adaptor subunit [Planctomycetota bacterium]
MKARLRLAAAVLPALLLALAGCDGGQAAAASPGAAPAVPVTLGRAERRDMPNRLHAVGNVESPAAVMLKPRVAGQVAEVRLQEGADVHAGEVLILLDEAPFKAALAAAEAALARDTVMAQDAQRTAESWDRLPDPRAASARTIEQAHAQAEAAKAGVAADQAAVDAARLDLDHCEIRAPFDGRSGRVLVRTGSPVKEQETELVSIEQVVPIRVAFALPERHLPAIRARRAQGPVPVEVSVPGGGTLQGALGFIDNAVDPATGTILLMADFANADRALWPGQLVDVALIVGVDQGAVVVPAGAVQPGQKGSMVFVVGADGTVQPRDVQVLRTDAGLSVLSDGLQGDETVVTDGQLRLVPGSRVEAAPDKP